MSLLTELLLPLGIFVSLIILGRVVGSRIEQRHYESLRVREARFAGRRALSTKEPEVDAHVARAALALGSVVVSVDYFKRFASAFRMLFGGEVRAYSSLIERARREAVLRMKESQPDAHLYVNTRIETSTISSTSSNEGLGTIEVLAYGTALTLDTPPNLPRLR